MSTYKENRMNFRDFFNHSRRLNGYHQLSTFLETFKAFLPKCSESGRSSEFQEESPHCHQAVGAEDLL